MNFERSQPREMRYEKLVGTSGWAVPTNICDSDLSELIRVLQKLLSDSPY